MDREDVVVLYNKTLKGKISAMEALDTIAKYCEELGKTAEEASKVVKFFSVVSNDKLLKTAFYIALTYFSKKYRVVLLSRKVNLLQYNNPSFINKDYFYAF